MILRSTEGEPVGRDLQRARHGELARFQVHIRPPEPQQFALPEPRVDSRNIKRPISGATGGGEQRADLSGGEGFGLLLTAATARSFSLRHVAGHEIVADCLLEGLL